MRKQFPHYRQLDQMDCGPTCLKMVAQYYGKPLSVQYLRENSLIDREGVSLLGLAHAAEKVGFRTAMAKARLNDIKEDQIYPCVVFWNQGHFVVLYEAKNGKVKVSDPATGRITFTEEEFKSHWLKNQPDDYGLLLWLEPSPDFFNDEYMGEPPKKTSLSFLFRYLTPYRKLVVQLLLSLLVGSAVSLLLPFFTQALVDVGVNQQNLPFIYLVLLAQLMLFVGITATEALRSWILLHISSRINIFIISDFFIKLMKLPIAFFDSKNTGDLMQRISDHERIKYFLSSSSLNFAFSLVNLAIFGGVMLYYSATMFAVFLLGTLAYVGWILLFMKRRKALDHKRFNQAAANQSSELQLIQGMQEIKLNNCEKQKRWEWEGIQVKLFRIGLSSLALQQYQNLGGGFINELKNILITFWAAKEVMEGQMTLGMMMAVQQILGQLNAPVLNFIHFIQEAQDASISMERLNEIHSRADEDQEGQQALMADTSKDLTLHQVDFRYGNPHADFVLHQVSLSIPSGKTTAIVGASGSGKTTLLKLLLKFYEPESGEIKLGETPLRNIDNRYWRSRIGTVMQDGYIFSDTIARNIALGEDSIDKQALVNACETANIREFIESLPLNYNTKIGGDGIGLSQGQRQRILIARAVYKNPDYLFFDEATSALDANNEREITEKIDRFAQGRTMVVVAHRLSTVKNAHQIVVLHQGEVAELGTHQALVAKRGLYYELIKNQLELGS